ncbi:MAG: hypothetical protein ACMXYD_02830 [Candidatus Woesearchaeota archaeon]
MAVNKRGVFFSLTTLVLVGSLFFLLSTDISSSSQVPERVQEFATDKEVFEQQIIPSLLRVHARQAINELVSSETAFASLSEVEDALASCLGSSYTVEGDSKHSAQTTCAGTVLENNLVSRLAVVEELYEESSLYNVSFQIIDVSLSQSSNWEVLLTAQVQVFMNDFVAETRYTAVRNVSTTLRVEGLADPLRYSRTGEVVRIRQQSRTGANFTRESFTQHALAKTYITDTNAPSYLDRLLGGTTASPFGISSVIIDTANNVSGVDYQLSVVHPSCLAEVALLGSSSVVYLPGPYVDVYRQFFATNEPGQQYNELACEMNS